MQHTRLAFVPDSARRQYINNEAVTSKVLSNQVFPSKELNLSLKICRFYLSVHLIERIHRQLQRTRQKHWKRLFLIIKNSEICHHRDQSSKATLLSYSQLLQSTHQLWELKNNYCMKAKKLNTTFL